jgi:hypothetical protein
VLFEKIKSGNYDADDPIWENISIEAKDVVAKLLTVRFAVRLLVACYSINSRVAVEQYAGELSMSLLSNSALCAWHRPVHMLIATVFCTTTRCCLYITF